MLSHHLKPFSDWPVLLEDPSLSNDLWSPASHNQSHHSSPTSPTALPCSLSTTQVGLLPSSCHTPSIFSFSGPLHMLFPVWTDLLSLSTSPALAHPASLSLQAISLVKFSMTLQFLSLGTSIAAVVTRANTFSVFTMCQVWLQALFFSFANWKNSLLSIVRKKQC